MNKNTCKFAFDGNPVGWLLLGLCPVAAAASNAVNGLILGIAMLFILLCGGILDALIRKIIPEKARIPAAVLILCTVTGIAQLLLNMLQPAIADELGIFVPLCAIGGMICLLPNEHAPAANGCKFGIASLIGLVLIGVLREVIGSGAIFGRNLWINENAQVLIVRFPAGAYILLGILLGIAAAIRGHRKEDTQ